MKRGKYEAPRVPKRRSSKKALAMLLSLVLVIGCVIGGTLAWLQASTSPVTNTFTVGDISLTLKESPYNADGTYGSPTENVKNSYPLIPGSSYKKNPVVEVAAGSEDCYLFVKIVEANNPSTYLTYTLALDGWKQLAGQTGVYYRTVAKTDNTRSWELLTGNTISVKDTVVKKGTATTGYVDMPDVQPQLVFTAYAVQQANLTVDQAWTLVSN